MLRRRGLCKRGLVVISAVVAVSLLYFQITKTPEIIIPEVCEEDRRQFLADINVLLDCDCARFRFKPSSYVDSLVNGFNSVGERHKTILYLTTLTDDRRVVLKYRKNSMRSLKLKAFYRPDSGAEEKEKILEDLLSGNGFNGHPHFCSLKANAYNRMSEVMQWTGDGLLVASMNFEVILLKFLKSSGLPVPDYIANCGLYLMESYGGLTMDHFYKSSVKCRLTIARNLLLAAKSLTEGHRGFRIYLTDATKDNIAVDEETLLVTFIDLDDVIIQYQEEGDGNGAVTNHKHQKMECENCFAFSSQDICAATQSDINIFTICQLLLEDLNGNYLKGFLYFQSDVLERYSKAWKERWADFLKKLRHCVYCDKDTSTGQLDRFQLVDVLVNELSLLIPDDQ